jgi:hypothetical protein
LLEYIVSVIFVGKPYEGRQDLFRDVGIANFNEREFGIGLLISLFRMRLLSFTPDCFRSSMWLFIRCFKSATVPSADRFRLSGRTCVTKMEFCMRHAKDKMIVEVLFRWIHQTTHSSEWLKILVPLILAGYCGLDECV